MSKKPVKIKYFDLYGLREEKYKFLESHEVKNTEWQEIEPKESYYFFVPKDFGLEEKYQKFISLKDIFIKNGSGVITRRDEFVVSIDKEQLERRIRLFLDKNSSKEMLINTLKIKDTYEWNLEHARDILSKDKDLDKKYLEYLYRPFDKRWIIYHEDLVSRPSVLLRQSFFGKNNIGLICSRRTSATTFNYVFISDLLADIHSAADQSYVFPIFVYGDETQKSIFKNQAHLNLAGVQNQLDESGENKKSNIKEEIIKQLSENYKKKISPEEIFYYIYVILYSNTYRKNYNEFLKIDFPKIPFTKDAKLFYRLSKIGKELIDLLLLKSEKLENISAKFPVIGDNRVKIRKYSEKDNRLYINDNQYFEGVGPEIWNYHIGGYQVLDKWLKDRKDRVLTPEDANHLLKVITALNSTINSQKEIDKLYPEVENDLAVT